MKRIMLLTLVLLLSLVSFSRVEAKAFNETEWGILQLERIGIQTQMIENDMRLCLNREDFRNSRKSASKDALKKLKKLSAELNSLVLDPKLEPLRASFKELITRLETLYRGLDRKDDEQITRDLEAFWNFVDQYNTKLKEAMQQWLDIPNAPPDSNLLADELKAFKTDADRQDFLKANEWVNKKRMDTQDMTPAMSQEIDEAWKVYDRLYKAYLGTAIEGVLLQRLTQSAEVIDNNENKLRISDPQGHAAMLKAYLTSGRYSTALLTLYLQWVPLEQMINGMSNMSDIPNELYLDVRWQIVKTIQAHLKAHPTDDWAKLQALMIMDEPIIERDCGEACSMGNSAFSWISRAYL